MKQLLILTALILNLLIVHPAVSSEISEGREAYESGDYFTAMEILYPLAEQGSAEAQFILGVMYRKGLGVGKDGTAALKWTTDAAQGGHAEAQYYLGLIYHTGFGIAKDLDKARDWYQLAADQGHTKARKNLSRMNPELAQGGTKLKGQTALNTNLQIPIPQKMATSPASTQAPSGDTNKGQETAAEKKGDTRPVEAKDPDLLPAFQLGLNTYIEGDKETARKILAPLAEGGHASAQFFLGLLLLEESTATSDGSGDATAANKWLELSARQGKVRYLYNQGRVFEYGLGTVPDLETAVMLYKLAAAQGNKGAQEALARINPKPKPESKPFDIPVQNQDMVEIEKDAASIFARYYEGLKAYSVKEYNAAIKYWTPLAEQGHADSQYGLGLIYANDKYIPGAEALGVKWYKRAAAQGHEKAIFDLNLLSKSVSLREKSETSPKVLESEFTNKNEVSVLHYQKGLRAFDQGDYVAARTEWQSLAEQGNTEAQYQLASLYFEGQGGESDFLTAGEWYKLAAEMGHAGAQHKLGMMYFSGAGFGTNLKAAEMWLKRSAEQGYAPGQYMLGYFYSNNRSIVAEEKEVYRLVQLAADQGLADAQVYLGYMYELVGRIDKDKEKTKLAIKWYSIAAEQGDKTGQYLLGVLYKDGRGVPTNYKKAFGLIYQSAMQGHERAQTRIGDMYERGLGVPVDIAEARKWYRRSAAQGYTSAKRSLEELNKKYPVDSKTENPDLSQAPDLTQARELTQAPELAQAPDLAQAREHQKAVNAFLDEDFVLVGKIWTELAGDGYSHAQFGLALLYREGEGKKKDLYEAGTWFERAANQGHAVAQYLVGGIYHYGRMGRQKDLSLAKSYYQKASAQGHQYARSDLRWLLIEEGKKTKTEEKNPETIDQVSKGDLILTSRYQAGVGAYFAEDYQAAYYFLEPYAEQGHARAQLFIALVLRTSGYASEIKLTEKWLIRAAEQGEARAQFLLGQMYGRGRGVRRNYEQAELLLQQAKEQGFKAAEKELIWLENRRLKQKAADQGNERASISLKRLKAQESQLRKKVARKQVVMVSIPKPKRKPSVIPARIIEPFVAVSKKAETKTSAQLAHWSAEFNKGLDAYNAKNYPAAVQIWEVLSQEGHDLSQYNLGYMYSSGEGGQQNFNIAKKWFELAAIQGNWIAMNKLGVMYFEGQGVPQDYRKARKWFSLGADKGYSDAQFNLALMYRNGNGVEINDEKAASLYQEAADQGTAAAQYNLGQLYKKGEGVQKNDIRAVALFKQAAAQENAPAQHVLGIMYFKGTGVKKDFHRAYMWWSLAASQGHEEAKSFVAIYERDLSKASTNRGKRLARECIEKNYKNC